MWRSYGTSGTSRGSQRGEVLEQLQPDALAFFRVKLCGDKIVAGEQVSASYDTKASALSKDYEAIRIQRGLYTALADIVTADAGTEGPLDAAALVATGGRPGWCRSERWASETGERAT